MVATMEAVAEERHIGEDVVTSSVEKVTSKVPSGVFLIAGMACVALAAGLAASGRIKHASFVGLWAPTILIMGVYNKLVKEHEPG
jgi:hypothetical protein